MNKKILIISHARSGKDTLAEYWAKHFNFTFTSSSMAAARIFIYDKLKDKYGYKTFEECFEDRMEHRAEWYSLIAEYNKDDKARLAKAILKESDCYVGMRDKGEITECLRQKLFDLIIWVDASKRIPPESPNSFNIDESISHIIIDNNGTEEEFLKRANALGKALFSSSQSDLKKDFVRERIANQANVFWKTVIRKH